MNIKQLLEIKKAAELFNIKSQDLYKQLKENCHCHETRREHKQEYQSGGYDYTASTEYWEVCNICGKHHNKRTVNHGWYG